MLCDSKFGRFAAFMLRTRFSGELIELPRGHVAFKLPIPHLPVILGEPIAERRQLFGRQVLNFALEGFNLSHGGTNDTSCRVTSSQRFSRLPANAATEGSTLPTAASRTHAGEAWGPISPISSLGG